jgi:hypothetical protein
MRIVWKALRDTVMAIAIALLLLIALLIAFFAKSIWGAG